LQVGRFSHLLRSSGYGRPGISITSAAAPCRSGPQQANTRRLALFRGKM
jgi:hypothetical protein